MPITRFDPDENKPYGSCLTCSSELATRADAKAHLDETFAQSDDHGSHRVRITNPSREERIEDAVKRLVADATEAFVDELQTLVDQRHLSADEATTAVRRWSEFADAWHEAA